MAPILAEKWIFANILRKKRSHQRSHAVGTMGVMVLDAVFASVAPVGAEDPEGECPEREADEGRVADLVEDLRDTDLPGPAHDLRIEEDLDRGIDPQNQTPEQVAEVGELRVSSHFQADSLSESYENESDYRRHGREALSILRCSPGEPDVGDGERHSDQEIDDHAHQSHER